MPSNEVSSKKNIDVALKLLEGIKEVSVIDVNYIENETWNICVDITLTDSGKYVPSVTRWWYVISKDYPFGVIECYPDSTHGIVSTHNHQKHNGYIEGKKWREGSLCLDEPFRFRRIVQHNDPIGNRELRLRWYVKRTIDWLNAAIENSLVKEGDPFELPWLNYKTSLNGNKLLYSEDQSSYNNWSSYFGDCGFATISSLRGLEKCFIISEFYDWKRKNSISRWSSAPMNYQNNLDIQCFWWLWKSPIVMLPWQVPINWGELRKIGKEQKIDVDKTLRKISNSARNKGASVLLLGYPIPQKIGEPDSEIHFDAILLPTLSKEIGHIQGFRNNNIGYWNKERRIVFGDDNEINYMAVENWHPDRLLARGRISKELREIPTVIIGVGALGSVIAEMLVREGMQSILLVDHDYLSAGNIVRHTLTLNDIGNKKTEVMKSKLESINPFVNVETYDQGLPVNIDEIHDILNNYKLIVDCTGSDDVLQLLGLPRFSFLKSFASFSLGYRADRIYAHLENGFSFSVNCFQEEYDYWKNTKTEDVDEHDEIIEGAGCWSPIFPARYDDVVIAGSICVKLLEKLVSNNRRDIQFTVYERLIESDICTGYTEIQAE